MAKNRNATRSEGKSLNEMLKFGNTEGGCEQYNSETYKIYVRGPQNKANVYTFRESEGDPHDRAMAIARENPDYIERVTYYDGKSYTTETYTNIEHNKANYNPQEMSRASNDLKKARNRNKRAKGVKQRRDLDLVTNRETRTRPAKMQKISEKKYTLVCINGPETVKVLNYDSKQYKQRKSEHKASGGKKWAGKGKNKKKARQSCGPPKVPSYCYCANSQKAKKIVKRLEQYIQREDKIPYEGLVFEDENDVKKAIQQGNYTKINLSKTDKGYKVLWVDNCEENPTKR